MAILNRYNADFSGDRMLSTGKGFGLPLIFVFIGLSAQSTLLTAQTVRIDVNPFHAVTFDPDQAMGTSMDILPAKQFETVYSAPIIKESLSAGWGPITYRQNTELTINAWHWNPDGKWSDAQNKRGYFIGSAEPTSHLRKSFGYKLPHRGSTRSDSGQDEFSRITDGNPASYWKSNPYFSEKFTGEPDSQHPQWVVVDFATPQDISAIEIHWTNPYATEYVVEYWSGKDDAISKPASGRWVRFPLGDVKDGVLEAKVQRLADHPISTRFVRVWMTKSSDTCDTHGDQDPRNCVGYAISEISAGNFNAAGQFVDLVRHTSGQAQTNIQVSSNDSWHTAEDIVPARIQTGFDLFFTSGITNHLPAMIPVSMLYGTPEDSAAQLTYIEKRGYPISFVEMGEEPDGQFMLPEDYAALYLQWATALHRVDPKLKLGGPIFTGVNEDIQAWPDAQGRTSWLARFLDYLRAHGRMNDLTFVSFEHYPFPPCDINWTDLYREPSLMQGVLKTWREDGVSADIPLMITESGVSWALTDPMQDIFSALWAADSYGAFLVGAGPGGAYYHSPIQPEPLRSGCHGWSTYGNFVANENLEIRQHTAQYFASQLLNLEWVKHGAGKHQIYPAQADVQDEVGNMLVTAYAVKRPDENWSLLLINKDPSNAHEVTIQFVGSDSGPTKFVGKAKKVTFGAAEYVWHAAGSASYAEPDGPARTEAIDMSAHQKVTLPRASVTVLTGPVR
jgi:F5/8 type C domain